MDTFTWEPLHIDDAVVYLKNERTGSSTIRKCKFLGKIIGFTSSKVKIMRMSPPDVFVTLDECKDLGVDTICPDDVVDILWSKYQEDEKMKLLGYLNDIIANKDKDIKLLLGGWFSALEDEGVNPWMNEDCMKMANKYWYTEEDHKKYLSIIC